MTQNKPHFSFWLIATVGLGWNLINVLSYLAEIDPAVILTMPEAHQLILNARPQWATAAAALEAFGGAVGCILLLLRRKVAVAVLTISVIGFSGTAFFMGLVVGVVPSMMLAGLICVALLWYATIAQRRSWLG